MDKLTLLLVAVLLIERIATVVIAWTKTKKDDEILAEYKKAKGFILTHAGGVFDIAKLLFDTGILKGDGAAKMEEYKKKLDDAYFKIEGKRLPDNVLEEAELVAEGIYASKKLEAPQVTASAPAVEVSEQE